MKKISAVLIFKNEEAMLPRVLNSLKGIDEIILCDTGSKDRSVQVCEKLGYKTQYFEWCDDFAKARNYAKSFATGDWILSIDCDEILHDLGKVREAVEEAEKIGTKAVNVNLISEDGVAQVFVFPRLFKNDPEVWWEGAIHNHISKAGTDIGDVWITYGYSPAHHLDQDRAYRILQKEVAEKQNGREMFYLGREHFYRGEFDKALEILSKYVNVSKFLAEKAEAFLVLARIYWQTNRGDEARDCCAQAIIINAHFKEAIKFMAEISFPKNAEQWNKLAETADNSGVLFVRNV